MELRTVHTPTGGCSRESSAMGESLTERRRVVDEVFRDLLLLEVIAVHQLVGGVTAHQGDDG